MVAKGLALLRDDSGLHSVEIALGIALIAAVAGFGMIALGEGIAAWFTTTGDNFEPGASLPDQCSGSNPPTGIDCGT